MTDSIYAEMTRDSPKSENGEHLIVVIWLNDLSNVMNCVFILVLGAHEME